MTFQNLETARIIRAVAFIFAAGIAIAFLTSCLSVTLWPSDMVDRLSNTFTSLSDPDTTPEQLQDEMSTITTDYSTEIAAQYVVQWSLAGLLTFAVARRTTAAAATSPAQASSYGLAIGLGTAFTYGVLCVLCSISMLWLRLLFFLVFIFAGLFGGQAAVPLLGKAHREEPPSHERPTPGKLFPSPPVTRAPAASATRPEVYYNMGVTAAMGGRRDEARQHFTHVVQMQPRNVAAWLQLANLADTPEQAWNYVQQARNIAPNNPQVKEAVGVIWPRLQANASSAPAAAQPPYPGGASDDTSIPAIHMPRPAAPESPEAEPPADEISGLEEGQDE